MNLKSSWEIVGRILFGAAALALPLTSAGCGERACIQWSAVEGACPAQSKALPFFDDPRCPGDITSVDSEGAYANDLCCYAVTKQDNGSNGAVDVTCLGGLGQGGAGGSFGTSTTAVSGTSGTGEPPPPPCVRCGEAFLSSGIDATNTCFQAQNDLTSLAQCICNGPCEMACANNACLGETPQGSDCEACAADATNGCGTLFSTCLSDR